jgi:transcriptional regulator with XRE-family HTH domain
VAVSEDDVRLKIKEWMELRNVSQAQIAAALGASRATVSAWVEGRPGKDGKRVMVFPDADGFEALCLFFECTPSDLLELQRRKTSTGLIWRDFRDHRRGPGRPPRSAIATKPDDEVDG